MGFARTVNEDLTDGTEILIMEMGARRVGDIKEMCELLEPHHGMITGVAPCHLETFGSMENIRKTKYELFDYVKGIKVESGGDNVKCCAEMARKLGVSEENIERAVKNLPAVPHRAQVIPAANGVTVIDDGYNSNPVGAKKALEALSKYTGAKIVQTPGFVELGDFAYEYNKEFAASAAGVADAVIIMGQLNKTALCDGLRSANYPDEKIFFADNMEQAKKLYAQILHAGDTLLLENDLPENY
jgi:UDP-N-acetylmuramoyl-tripeptide--D-alanyl-D-alanine ligase